MSIQRITPNLDGGGAIRRPKTDPIYNDRPSAGRGTHTDAFGQMRDGSTSQKNTERPFVESKSEFGDAASALFNPQIWGSSGSGSGSSGADNYASIYELLKDYPEWVAMLDANPYKGLHVPESLFDKIGLSNKAKDKMIALKQEYLNYNAQILANFLNWKNSLPTTQREQLNEAGYASDLAQTQPSQISNQIPQGSNALAMPSGSTADDLMSIVGTAASLFTSGTSIAMGVMSTLSNIALQKAQKDNLEKHGEGQDITNFNSSLDAAKRIYSNLAPTLKKPKDPDEIMAAVSLQYPDAPESVNKALKNYVNSREFQEGLLQSETGIQQQESAFNQAYMTNEDLKLLVGSPDYWLGIRTLANKTYMDQVRKIDEFIDTLDTVTYARSSNAYMDYIQQYYSELSTLGVPSLSAQAAVMQNKAALATYDMQKSLAQRNKTMIEACNMHMQEYFGVLTDPDASEWKKFWAASFLTSNSFLTRFMDPMNVNTGAQPFSPVGFSMPSMPSLSLPSFK